MTGCPASRSARVPTLLLVVQPAGFRDVGSGLRLVCHVRARDQPGELLVVLRAV